MHGATCLANPGNGARAQGRFAQEPCARRAPGESGRVYPPPTPARATMEVDALRLFIREKLQDGRLPHEQISQVQSRPADGQKCDACEKPVTMAQFVVTGTTLAGRGSIQLHVECFQLWDDVRQSRSTTFASRRKRVSNIDQLSRGR